MIKLVAKILKVLNSETEPYQISLALCLAMIIGFTPLISLHNLIVLLIVLIVRVNLSAFILGLAIFSGLSYALDPLFHSAGMAILTAEPLQDVFTSLYNTTIFRMEHFYNTVLMGSLITSIILFLPLYIILKAAIVRYRQSILLWVRKSKIMHAFKLSKFYKVYDSLEITGDNS